LFFGLLDGNGNRLLAAFEDTIERYKQDRNVFFLLITNKCEFRCCGSIIERNGPLNDSAKMKSPGCSSDHRSKRSSAVAGNPQTHSANAAYRPKRRILWCPKAWSAMRLMPNLTAAPDR
jgi:hypothetical protein